MSKKIFGDSYGIRVTGICQDWKLSELIFIQNWKLSELEFVRIGNCQNQNLPETNFISPDNFQF